MIDRGNGDANSIDFIGRLPKPHAPITLDKLFSSASGAALEQAAVGPGQVYRGAHCRLSSAPLFSRWAMAFWKSAIPSSRLNNLSGRCCHRSWRRCQVAKVEQAANDFV